MGEALNAQNTGRQLIAWQLYTTTRMTMREIGERMGGISRERVRQLVEREAGRLGRPYPYRRRPSAIT